MKIKQLKDKEDTFCEQSLVAVGLEKGYEEKKEIIYPF